MRHHRDQKILTPADRRQAERDRRAHRRLAAVKAEIRSQIDRGAVPSIKAAVRWADARLANEPYRQDADGWLLPDSDGDR